MSQERRTTQDDPHGNIARGQEALAAWNAGDFDRFVADHHEHVVMHHPPGWPEPGPSFGAEAVRKQYRRVFDVGWGRGGLERLGEPIAVGDRTITRSRFPMEAQGVEMVTEMTSITTWREGKIILIEWYWDHGDALRAVGLLE